MVISDNGPQFASDTYARFASEYRFDHVTAVRIILSVMKRLKGQGSLDGEVPITEIR